MSNTRLEQLFQIFNGAIWDGDLISKHDRNSLARIDLVQRTEHGYNIITAKGVKYVIELGLIHRSADKAAQGLSKAASSISQEKERAMNGFVIYVCPDCGRTIRWPDPSTSAPNTICQCRGPDYVTEMVVCWPPSSHIPTETDHAVYLDTVDNGTSLNVTVCVGAT